MLISGTRQRRQVLLPTVISQPLTADSVCAKAITNAMGVFIMADMPPYSVVENTRFKHMVVIEFQYSVPSRVLFSHSAVPALFKWVQAAVVQELSTGQLLLRWSITNICVYCMHYLLFIIDNTEYFNCNSQNCGQGATSTPPRATENIPNRDTNTYAHTKLWLLSTVTPVDNSTNFLGKL